MTENEKYFRVECHILPGKMATNAMGARDFIPDAPFDLPPNEWAFCICEDKNKGIKEIIGMLICKTEGDRYAVVDEITQYINLLKPRKEK